MASSTSGITFTGLASNIDTEAIVSQLMVVERQQQNLIKLENVKLNYEKTALEEVRSSLLALQKLVQDFKDGFEYDTSVTSSSENYITGSATVAADDGVYQIEVISLATQDINKTDAMASGWTAGANNYTATFTMGNGTGTAFTINDGDILATDTLQQVANKINSLTNGTEKFTDYAKATVLTNADGTQVLTIKTNAAYAGEANRISYSDTNGFLSTLGLDDAGNRTLGTDAVIKIDSATITSSTNTVTTAIPNVTLNLKAVTTAPVTVTVGLDTEGLADKVEALVEQFNTTTKLLNTYMDEEPLSTDDIESSTDYATGILYNDMDLSSAKYTIRMETTGYTDSTLSTYKILAQIGISSEESTGGSVTDTIVFDRDAFISALEGTSSTEVGSLLEGWADNLDTYLDTQTKTSVISSEAGNFYRRITSIEDSIDDNEDEISDWDDKLESIEERYRTQFSEMESVLSSLQSTSSYVTSMLKALSSSSS